MTGLDDWQKNNDEFLAAGVKWLRLLLEQKTGEWASAGQAGRGTGEDEKKRGDSEIARQFEKMQAAEKNDPPPALSILARRLGFSRFEQEVLLLCAAMELDTRIAPLCARAQGDVNKPYPTFALAMALFDDPAWEILSPERPLRYMRLIEISQSGMLALTASPLRADERIVNYLKGLNYLDDRLAPLLTPVGADDGELPPSQKELAEAIHFEMREAGFVQNRLIFQLTGPESRSKELIAASVASSLGHLLCKFSVESLPQQPAELDSLSRLWERETLLLPLILYLDANEADSAGGEGGAQRGAGLGRFLRRTKGLFVVDTRDALPALGEGSSIIAVSAPTAAEQQAAWEAALGYAVQGAPAALAGQFNLDIGTIRRIAGGALADAREAGGDAVERMWKLCLTATRPRLESLAQRVDAKATWDDIVLPKEATSLLRQIAEQVRLRMKVYVEWGFAGRMNRGLGITALFAGASGTGKTMAAEVIANELKLDLYRIDLSAVVNKYIGETEKNLRKLFDAAEDGGAILFFDEADALFGKRSEVKDSHDRYANIEVNYLLQRMESYRGLAILASNMKTALDQAFMRRLRFIVNFPFPGRAERKAIWEKVFPEKTPIGDLDYDHLARLNLSGGDIHNIGLNAAFLACAGEPKQVTMRHVLDAARGEYRKIEKPINEADFVRQGAGGGAA